MVVQNQGSLLNQDLQLSMPVILSHEISKIIGDRNQLKLWQLKVCVLSLKIWYHAMDQITSLKQSL